MLSTPQVDFPSIASSQRPTFSAWQESLSRDELRSLQLRRLRTLCEWAENRSAFYKRHFMKAGFESSMLNSFDDIRRIPFVDKRIFLADQEEAPPYGARLTVPESEIHRAFLTSGTTGIGQEVHCFTRREWAQSAAAREWQFRQMGLKPGDAFAVTLPLTMQIGGAYLVNAAEKYGLRVMALSSYTTAQKVALLERFDPHAMVITPAYAARLEDEARMAGHGRWEGRLKGVLIVGESFTDRWIHAVNSYWGVPTYEYYGTSQSGMGHAASCHRGILRDGERGMMHNLDPYHLCEVIDPETGLEVAEGESGEVIQTPLFKFASPVIRFKTDDRAIRRLGTSCGCGLQWDGLMSGEITRFDDMIKAKGQNFWPSAVHEVIDAAFPGVEYRGRVFVDDTGRERIALKVEGTPEQVASLQSPIRSRTNLTMELEAVKPGSLDRFEFKSRRWEDTRKTDRDVIAYREKR